ncbi:TIM barrel protein [Devosia sp. 2618]|uniref:hydroxypyruvate isomerase family protein n=1 Tax=Devosia sp. 2618 TaxID=3156454 RepID=UPI0033989E12
MAKFSANLGFLWPELPLPQRIDAAARAGFSAVELHSPYDYEPEVIGQRCRDAGVKLLGINTQIGAIDRGCAAVPGRGEEARAQFDQALDFVTKAGGTAVHFLAGFVPPDQHSAGKAQFAQSLGYAAPLARAQGITILLETMNKRDMPDYFYDSIEETRECADTAGGDVVKLMFDCYHIGILQGDVTTRLRNLMPAIGHVQIAAVPSRAEPDEGELNYSHILNELDALGYGGWVGCEYRPRTTTDAGLTWLKNLGVQLTTQTSTH